VHRNTIKRAEKLKSPRIIGELFNSGDTITVFPLKLFWSINNNDQPVPARFAVAVPARNIRNAVDRNRIKRRIREAYRLNKHIFTEFLSDKKLCFNFVFLFLPKTISSYDQISGALIKILMNISNRSGNIINQAELKQ
jgi:ribonuclease P protein component